MHDEELRLTASPCNYRRRRAALAAKLRRPLVIFAGHAPARNYAGNPHPFRAGSTYLYFGGPPLEDAALIIEPGSDGDEGSALLRVFPGPDDVLWGGEVPGDSQIAAASGIDAVRIASVDRLSDLPAVRSAAAVVPPCLRTMALARDMGLESAAEEEVAAIVALRLIKDEEELSAIGRAVSAAVAAHRAAMASTAVGRTESDVEAALCAALVAHRCTPSFSPIVTVRGEVLHGAGAARRLEDGALMLVDAGAEEKGGYASDITRTFPVNGRWTPVQRHLYDTTLRAMREAIAACSPGRRFLDIHAVAARVICEGLVEAELLCGDPSDVADRGAYTLFFPHGVGHLLGLDVHDMEDFGDLAGYAPGRQRPERFGDRFLRLDRDLEPGMVVTIEPGVYFVPAIWQRDDLVAPFADVVNRPKVDALLRDRFGGIRIEADVAIREGEPEVLTGALPSGADEVAALVGIKA